MSTIGGGIGGGNTVNTSTSGAGTVTPPAGTTTAPIALAEPRLAAQAAALADVASGAATVRFGAFGPHVKAVQEVLSDVQRGAIPATGTFDRATQSMLSAFQRRSGLTASGELDQATLAALDKAGAARIRPTTTRPTTGGTTTGTSTGGGRPVIGGTGTITNPPPTTPTTTSTTPTTGTTGTAGTTGVSGTTATTGVDPLAGKPYMDSKTFATMPPYQWARDSVELESVMGVSGMSKDELLDAVRSTNAAGRTLFQRLRKPEMANAFTLGYDNGGIEDLRWDSDSHALREKQKFVALTVEGGRYEADPTTGVREVSLGTDKMDDTYYDTKDNDLLKNDMSVRGRARWDTDTQIRRILIGVKANSTVDEFGTKSNDKTDVRNDGASPEEIKALDSDVRSGTTHWNGQAEAVKPLKGVYDALKAKDLLPDIGGKEDVLLLEPKVHIRSVRARYHMNEAELADVRKLHDEGGRPKIENALALVTKALADPKLTADEKTRILALETAGKELIALAKIPDRGFGGAPATIDELEKEKALAETIDAKYHAFAGQLDGVRRVLADARSDALEDISKLFVGWQKSLDKTLANKGAVDPFLAKYDKMTDADRTKFNEYGAAQKTAGNRDFRRFEPLTDAQWKDLRPALLNETLRVHQRMIESSGSAAKAVWFDAAREFYVPNSSRNTSNFIIDTFDLSEYVKPEDWNAIPEAQRTPANALPRDKVFHASLVAEAQIELGLEKPYMDRMKELSAEIGKDRASLAMQWMAAGGRTGVDRANPATFGIALATLVQLPKAQLDAEVAKLNDYLKAQGSALRPLTADDVKRLDPNAFTADALSKPVRKEPTLERNLDGARFIFEQYLGAQKFLSQEKGERVTRLLRDGGAPRSIEWKTTEAAKGETALRMLAKIP